MYAFDRGYRGRSAIRQTLYSSNLRSKRRTVYRARRRIQRDAIDGRESLQRGHREAIRRLRLPHGREEIIGMNPRGRVFLYYKLPTTNYQLLHKCRGLHSQVFMLCLFSHAVTARGIALHTGYSLRTFGRTHLAPALRRGARRSIRRRRRIRGNALYAPRFRARPFLHEDHSWRIICDLKLGRTALGIIPERTLEPIHELGRVAVQAKKLFGSSAC